MGPNVHVSEDMSDYSRQVVWICRLFGLFPITLKRTGTRWMVGFSPWYTLYSYALGLYVVLAAYYNQLYENFSSKNKSVHVLTKTDGIVRFVMFIITCKLILHAVFVMPWKLHQLCTYLRCIREVDAVINISYTKVEKHKPGATLITLLTYNVCVNSIAVWLTHDSTKISVSGLLLWNSGYYSVFMMALVVKFINSHMEQILEKRIVRLTSILESRFVLNAKTGQISFDTADIKGVNQNKGVTVDAMSAVYLKLMDAANLLSDWFGINILMATMAMVCQLVGCKYFLIMLLGGKGTDLRKIMLRIGLFSVQVIRLLMIVEPWHSCNIHLETVKRGVCKLLSLKVDEHGRKKINSFAMILCLRQFQFSAGGYFNVNRGLYTSVIQLIITFLVISLQAEETD